MKEMSFFGATVYDATTETDHMSRDGFPVLLPEGHSVAVSYLTRNTGNETVITRNLIEFIDRTGTVLSSLWEPSSGYFTVSPETFMTSKKTPYFSLNKAGIWRIYGLIEIESASPVEYTWEAIQVEESPPGGYECPYCDAAFDTYEEWRAHIEQEHGEEPGNGTSEDILKWALIGGGIIAVSLFVIRPLLKRSK